MSAHHPAHRSRTGRILSRALLGTLLVVVLVIGGTAIRVWQVARADDRQPVDIVVVLGAAQYHGKPSDILEARLEQALGLYEDGLTDYIVTVGGRKAGDTYTEAQAGKNWLVENGVPRDKIVDVDVGSDTLGSMQAVTDLAEQRRWDTALIVSDPWHSLRARTMATDMGLESWASPARSGPVVQTREIQMKYIVRETGALLYYRLTHAPAELNGDGLG
ncbi:YdcF family protein [Saccharopolyspora sp. TS4A08]|uniref:YdcF family protein n=1 Tax=Saccharopolyspora ipomoeae TaxID=3042027 RepID=A0ABT6PUN5_9PSEU|nr:YdcF family protein [Saccharopolyspora sp. TS4A08]MDI2031715.1 YdcF family protein [Saccharopolyspora sp. TS4A08]